LPLLGLVAACRAGSDYVAPRASAPASFAASAGDAPAGESEPVAAQRAWWKRFDDPTLDALVERALAGNLDLVRARWRVAEARALRDAAAGGRRPELDFGAGVGRSEQGSNATPLPALAEPRDSFELGFDARWELDLAGSRARAVEAAQAGLEAARLDGHAARLALLGEVARLYVEWRGLERERDALRANLELQRDTVELTRARAAAGLASELDVARAQALYAATQAQEPALALRRLALEHALAVLSGEPPRALAELLAAPAPIPSPPAGIDAGLPSECLQRRPDVRAAERRLAQAAALEAQAVAELFPRLSLGGSAGLESLQSQDLLDSASRAWSLGAELGAPLLRGGALRAQVRARGAAQAQALADYEQAVLDALREVEDALAGCAELRRRERHLRDAAATQAQAEALARELFAKGLADYFAVLEAQRALVQAQAELARGETELALAHVALYKALGGGWAAR
jgi:NodT family efflux transporter outer membrane factor (OMF) lipoprotein